tara:strand:+ start:71 stop:691 length:621 start_codon:yes stop_codon:yes gene_type:complete
MINKRKNATPVHRYTPANGAEANMFFDAAAYKGPITAPTMPPVNTNPMHFGRDRRGTRVNTAKRKLWPAAAGSANSNEEKHRAPNDFSAHAMAAIVDANMPTHEVTLYVFSLPFSLANTYGRAMLHALRLTIRNARGTVFQEELGENAELARLVAVIDAVTTLKLSAQPALRAYTPGQSCRCASSGASSGDAMPRRCNRACARGYE